MTAPIPAGLTVATGLRVEGLAKAFGATKAIDDVALSVAAGEIVALTGPSGAGKTTLLRTVAGLEQPDRGRLYLGGADVTARPAGQRRVALLFESYALYPHLTVRANAASPLIGPNGGRLAPAAREARIDAVLDLLEIGHLGARLPSELSGGQKQRAALARVLVQDAAAVLLDEPISHLDAKLRYKLRGELRSRLSAGPAPVIWATPDAMEALSIADRVAVIDEGRLQQVGTPEEVWLTPANVRVARLLGDPPMNLISGELVEDAGELTFRHDILRLPLPPALRASAHKGAARRITLGARADALRLAAKDAPGSVPAEVYSYEPFGKHAVATLRLAGLLMKVKTPVTGTVRIGDTVGVVFPTSGLTLFDGVSGMALSADAMPIRSASSLKA